MDLTSASLSDRPPLPGPAPAGPLVQGHRDPFAVALANMSLLGVGYLMLGRRWLALCTPLASVVLVVMLGTVGQPARWLRLGILLYWLITPAHAWYLARRARRSSRPGAQRGEVAGHDRLGSVRTQRLVALAVTGPVLLAFAGLRVDAERIENAAADAHRENECGRALSILEGLWAGHRVVNGRLAARSGNSVEACQLLLRAERQARDDRLQAVETLKSYGAHPAALWEGAADRRAELLLAQAEAELDTVLDGWIDALDAGFGHLSTVLGDSPGHKQRVGEVLDTFLDRLPTEDACDTKRITDWLAERPAGGNALDRSRAIVPEVAPAAILACGDSVSKLDPREARRHYRQLLDEYPDHDLAAKADRGVTNATQAIQLSNVRELLSPSPGGNPEYCDHPAPYSGAKPYRGKGPHRTLMYGGDQDAKFPASWRARTIREAVLVICAGEAKFGSEVETCYYESGSALSIGPVSVTFRKKKIPVRVYEMRTGRLVSDTPVQIGGDSCPDIIRYTYYHTDFGPPSEKYVSSSTPDVRAAFRPLINP